MKRPVLFYYYIMHSILFLDDSIDICLLYCVLSFCLCCVFHVRLLYDRICGPTKCCLCACVCVCVCARARMRCTDFPYNDRQNTSNVYSPFLAVGY
jgi:hypothetical protein